ANATTFINSMMKNISKALAGMAIIMLAIYGLSSFYMKEEWVPLLDKDMSKWEVYLSYRHKNGYNGDLPKAADGSVLEPIGYNKDATKVFSMLDEKGEPVLKVSGEIYGSVFTKQEFENYHLRLKVKWGDK